MIPLIAMIIYLNIAQPHVIHWNADPRSFTLVAFGVSTYDQDFAKFAVESNLSVAMVLLPITGDVEADFTALCGMINKTNRPVGIVDASWKEMESYRLWADSSLSPESENGVFQPHRNDMPSPIHHEAMFREPFVDTRLTVRCYRRQLLVSLSSRLQLPLLILSELRECPGAHIEPEVDWINAMGQGRWTQYPYHRLTTPHSSLLTLSIAPDQELLAELLRHLTTWNEESWNGFAIVYENEYDFRKYRKSLANLQTNAMVRCWEKNSFYKTQLIRDIKHLHAFFLDLSIQNIEQFFQMVANHEMDMQHSIFYIFSHASLQQLLNVLRNVEGDVKIIRFNLPPVGRVTNQDSLYGQLCGHAINYYTEAIRAAQSELFVPEHVSCEAVKASVLLTTDGLLVSHRQGPEVKYKHGQQIFSQLQNLVRSSIGYTDSNGLKGLDYGIEILSARGGGTRQYANWTSKRGFSYARSDDDPNLKKKLLVENKTFTVTTIEDPPFVIYEPFRQGKQMHGKDQWTGFAIELLKHLSKMNHFDYVIKPVADGKFGTFDESTGSWNGMIGELFYKKADLAVASLTITYDRERVIDFTTPYLSLSLSVIIKKSSRDPGLQFTAPLSREVWLSVLIAYIVVSLTLFILGRVTPHEWYPRHPCSTTVENQFTLLNSFWFTVGSLMQQGCDISPRATSTRIIGTIWWFFILIMVSSYTANLAAFLTVDRLETEIANIEDLTRQTKIKYGTLYGGSTYSFFKQSDIPTYQRMWEFMNSNKSLFVNRTEDGISRTIQGGYAFILESTLNEYYSQRNCDLTSVGDLLDPRGYGIGLPIGNNGLRDLLSESILKLQKDQTLEKMRQYWLQHYNATVPCYLQASKSAVPSRSKLTMSKMSTAFIGLGAGVVCGILVWIAEMSYWLFRLRRPPNRKQFHEISTHIRHLLRGSCRYDNTRRHSLDESLIKPNSRYVEVNRFDANGFSDMGTYVPVNVRKITEL